MKVNQSETSHNRNPDKTPQISIKFHKKTSHMRMKVSSTESSSQHNMKDSRYLTAASPLALPPHVQRFGAFTGGTP